MNNIKEMWGKLNEMKKEKKVLVKNMHSGKQKVEGGALNAWKKSKGYDESVVVKCSRCNCQDAKHGGHVVKANPGASKEWYIVPLCIKCNEKKDEDSFEVYEDDMVRVIDIQ